MPDQGRQSANDLQSRMAELRRELHCDVTQTAAAAKQLTDWRYYVRQFPWASAAAIAAIGFMLVPRKRERPLVDEAALERMVAEKRVVVIPQKSVAAKQSMAGSIGGMLAATAGRLAMNYISQRIAELNRPLDEESPARMRVPK